jgi:CBS domain-containing protein
MTRPVVTVDARHPIRKAANVMRGRSIGSLVVTAAGRAVGIITISDLLEILGRGLDRPVATATRRTLSHRAPHRKRHRSTGPW